MKEHKESFNIDDLVNDLDPVTPLAHPRKRYFLWLCFHLVLTTLITLGLGPLRNGFEADLLNPRFFLSFALYLGNFAFLSYLAVFGTIPGALPVNRYKWGSFLFLILVGVLVFEIFFPAKEVSMEGKRADCAMQILYLSFLPVGHLIYMVRKGIPFFSQKLALATAFSVGLLPASLMQIACMYDPMHGLKFHLGPAVFVGIIAFFLASFAFSKRNQSI